jgi:hypothetical protein
MVVFVTIMLSLIPHDVQYGPQAALIAESFTGRLRYSGASLGYQLASVIAGGPAPLIAVYLFAQTNSPYSISVYILICCVIGFAATALLKDRSKFDHGREYEEQDAQPPVVIVSALPRGRPELRLATSDLLTRWSLTVSAAPRFGVVRRGSALESGPAI